jgi:hypothetical protein
MPSNSPSGWSFGIYLGVRFFLAHFFHPFSPEELIKRSVDGACYLTPMDRVRSISYDPSRTI